MACGMSLFFHTVKAFCISLSFGRAMRKGLHISLSAVASRLCIYIYMYMYIYMHMNSVLICFRILMYLHTIDCFLETVHPASCSEHTYTSTYIYIYMYTIYHIHVYIHVYTCICICVCVCSIDIYTHTHTRARAQRSGVDALQ